MGLMSRLALPLGLLLIAPISIRADELDDMRTIIRDGIAANLEHIRCFEAQSHEVVASPDFASQKFYDREQDTHIFFEDPKWRQEISTTQLGRSGTSVPYHTDTVYDGVQTTRYVKEQNGAVTKGGIQNITIQKDLGYGYSCLDWHLPDMLRLTTSIKTVDAGEANQHHPLFEAVFKSTGTRQQTTTMWLDPAAGFLIIKARSEDGEGRLNGERRDTQATQVGDAWYLIQGTEEQWVNVNGERKKSGGATWDFQIAGPPQFPVSTWNIDFPPGTFLVNEITGEKHNLSGDHPLKGTAVQPEEPKVTEAIRRGPCAGQNSQARR